MSATSKGGLRVYFCPDCGSDNIVKTNRIGQDSWACGDCRRWGPWTTRGSRSATTGPMIRMTVKTINGWTVELLAGHPLQPRLVCRRGKRTVYLERHGSVLLRMSKGFQCRNYGVGMQLDPDTVQRLHQLLDQAAAEGMP